MTEQDRTSDNEPADVAADSSPAANQRAGEQEVQQPAAKDTVANTAEGAHRPGAPSGEVAPV